MYSVTIQRISKDKSVPTKNKLSQWAKAALSTNIESAEVNIRIVDEDEMTQLNSQYRHKNKPTNVLSFPFELPEDFVIDNPLLGDIVVCPAVVNREADEQGKTQEAHWAHMIVHGIYHLLGFDHENDTDAEQMEALETQTLKTLGFANPYQNRENM